jgi:hypothetical protein
MSKPDPGGRSVTKLPTAKRVTARWGGVARQPAPSRSNQRSSARAGSPRLTASTEYVAAVASATVSALMSVPTTSSACPGWSSRTDIATLSAS